MAAPQSVLSRSALITAGMAAQGVARLLYTAMIGHLATGGVLGDTSAVLSLAVYLSLVAPAGLGTAASRYLPLPHLAGAAIGVLNRWFWYSSIALAVAAAPIAYLLTHDLATSVTSVVLVWSYNAYVYTRGAMMGEDRIIRATVADFGSSLLAITALVAVLLGGAEWALLLPLSFGYALFAFFARPRTVPAAIGAAERSTISRFVRDATIGALATGGLLPATMIFVRAFDTPTHADLFAAALSLATPASMVSQAVNQVLIPHFARLHLDPVALRRSSRRLLIATTGLFAVVFAAVIALTPFILTLIYPQRFADGVDAMRALLVIVFLISATCAPSAFLVSIGRQRTFATIWLVALVAGTLSMAALSPLWGMWGALTGFALGGGGGSIAVIITSLLTPIPSVSIQAVPASERKAP